MKASTMASQKAPGSSSTAKKKQQSTLMSFFKPMAAKSTQSCSSMQPQSVEEPTQSNKTKSNLASSPLNSKSAFIKPDLSSDKESDKENDEIMDNTMHGYGSSYSSHTTSPLDFHQQVKRSFNASKLKQDTSTKTPLKERSTVMNSSPVANRRLGKKVNYAESDIDDDDDDDEEVVTRGKRRKIMSDVSDSDEEDEFKPDDNDDDADDDEDFNVDDNAMDDFIDDDEHEPSDDEDLVRDKEKGNVKRSRKGHQQQLNKSRKQQQQQQQQQQQEKLRDPIKSTNAAHITGVSSKSLFMEKFNATSLYSAEDYKPQQYQSITSATTNVTATKKNFAKENEERYQWLVNIKDAQKRTPDHPEYDPRTLYIPQLAWSKFTAFEKQYWEIKSQMWNTVVFFKKGKFYELYENDAIIANTKFDLKIAGGGRANMKLAGIPEMSFEHWAKEFISHGYKVAKVDQKESMLAKEIRGGAPGATKEEKIIKRELTGILTGGTLTDLDMISDDMSTYCLSIKEEQMEDGKGKKFGVAFVDTSTSELSLIELEDDTECTKLDTLVTQIKPKEIICEKGNLCSIATKILKFCAHSKHQIWNHMNPITEFWDVDITLEQLVKSRYFEAENLDDFSKYPDVLVKFKENHDVAFNAFGGLLSYLKTLKLDQSIMSLGNIKEYKISLNANSHMILDGITLNNLEILHNNYDGGDQGTLFKLLNQATTPFGKRQLKKWVLHPLIKSEDINARFDSVEYLMGDGLELRSILQDTLANLPDLERLIARIHSGTLRFKEFLRVIESFEKIAKVLSQLLEFTNVECGVLHKYLRNFPQDMSSHIGEWDDAFDRVEAKQNIIVPAAGIDEEFDSSISIINDLEAQLNQQLKEYKREYRSQEICYRDSGKEVYLIEMPVKVAKNVPLSWQTMGATSKVKRFWSPEVKQMARKLMEQRELHKSVCDTLKQRMYNKFDKHYQTWMKVITCMANIDCIVALTKVSETMGFPSCRPEFVETQHGMIDFKELRHPCFVGTKDFIPNDIKLGGDDEPSFGLLTGANAAGKSTIMRTTALAVILSQIGCFIPAELAKLAPVDRIMTRLGANDNIMQGKSTFFVELSETKKILSNATPRSLVILDELGRGGSSSDGFAVAESVLHHLATHLQSIGFFATHFNSLGLAFETHPQVKPMRMAIIVDQTSRELTFLYKLESGTAPGSFGMNVALMCGISKEIVDNAEVAAREYEKFSKLKRAKENKQENECGEEEEAEAEAEAEAVAVAKATEISLGLQSDCIWYGDNRVQELEKDILVYDETVKSRALFNIYKMIDAL